MYSFDEIQRKFEDFTNLYNANSYIVNAKKDHVYNVANNSIEIAKSLNLSKEDIMIAFLIGMLHDIGRFKEVEKYNELSDKCEMDHAEYGYKLLKNGLINQFVEIRDYDHFIFIAVRMHNKLHINSSLTSREKLFCQIIRDADKLDILKRLSDKNYTYDYDFDKSQEISSDVKEIFFHNESIPHSIQRNKMDQVVTRLAFVFDINYKYTLERIKNKKYIDSYVENLNLKGNNKVIIENMRKYANDYLDLKIKEELS
ncbi:MAG: HD domain-containing protein [Clostridia bacterium]|nr:HD domain-containing protein [Clostridia bacterium]